MPLGADSDAAVVAAASFLFVEFPACGGRKNFFRGESEVEGPINLQSDRNKAALWPASKFASRSPPRPEQKPREDMQVQTKKPRDSI
jgi:hypothetical protein